MPYRKTLLRDIARTLAVALAYTIVSLASLQLAIPPDYASPLYPSAGLALAAVLGWGFGVLPGIGLGAFLANVLLAQERGLPTLLSPALIGLGAMLQAGAGAWAIRRWVSQPLVLSEPQDLARFYAAGALSCLISPTVGASALLVVGAIPGSLWLHTWSSWWVGDTLGLLIAAPMALTLLGQPRKAWRPRRLSVGLPMLLTTLLLAAATARVLEWDAQRGRSVFEREAANASNALEARLREPLMALESLRSLMTVAPRISREEFARGTASFLDNGPLLAMGWAPRLQRGELAAFDRAALAEGLDGFKARDRDRPGDLQPPPNEDMLAIRLIEPLERNRGALGVNIRSIPGPRIALARAEASGLASATAGFQLSQDKEQSTGVVVYQALYEGSVNSPAERMAALRGVAFATLRPDLVLKSLPAHPSYVQLCLLDADPASPRRLLAGSPHCEKPDLALPHTLRTLSFAGRQWQILALAPQGMPLVEGAGGLPFALVGLVCTALLGLLLLTVTGRARRIEDLVRARTSELKREVQQRQHAAAALQDSELRFRNIFDTTPIGLVIADAHGVPLEANPHFCRLVGYSPDELKQIRSVTFTHPDDRAEDLRLGRLLLQGKLGMYRRDKRYLHKDGHQIHVRVTVSALEASGDSGRRLVGVVEDITDQLKMEELERAREAAEAANRAKSDFLSRMSHELRTPLNAMLGFAQLLEMDREHPLSGRQQAWTGQMQQAGWHLLEMIDDTLDLSRIESGALRLDLGAQDLDSLLDAALAMVDASAAQRKLSVVRQVDAGARHVQGDATRIKQILINLLSNAVKYNVEGGRIEIRGELTPEGQVALSVSDSGIGLTPEQLAGLFQPFNRLGREQSNVAGTGIGLVICKRLAEAMGGELRATSRAGLGSRFTLLLPAASADVPVETSRFDSTVQTHYYQQRRLIYIEDNPTNAEVMRGILAQRPQISWELCVDGQSGLETVLSVRPDLVLLDLQLPDIDGLELLQRLRAAGAAMPVVILSANALPEQMAACKAAGAADYLTKPVDVQALLTLLDQLLAGPPLASQ
ncbi:CHASE domain-containing protein [Pelomonas sp. SE-A7]|uniref:CHASE domain-containing protein n=1 Tax=Pelomonas sp. SE-A7 TaxID=3054953 RepID=UPI00259D1F75|nr:CHASE domain-containing protein [Pelomonas sp. SE-A7]MDM4767574.1 CHASE domain-containing protein [Pelomonas sp. SE-A7]